MSKVYTYEEIELHNKQDDLWLVIDDKVYDCSLYLDEHPGGEEVIVDCAGTDATGPFEDIGHSEDAREVLEGLLIGTVDPASKPAASSSSSSSSSSDSASGSSTSLILALVVVIVAVGLYLYTQN